MVEEPKSKKTEVLRLIDASELERFTGKVIVDFKHGVVEGGWINKRF